MSKVKSRPLCRRQGVSGTDSATLVWAGWTRDFEPRCGLVTGVTNFWGEGLVSAFAYTNDALGRRLLRVDARAPGVAATNRFLYNQRSEVSLVTMGSDTYTYAYDPIGNRRSTTYNSTAMRRSYTANALNQYASVTNMPLGVPRYGTLPAYDGDGNMTANGPWAYAWDAENRLVSACSNNVLLVSNTYDDQSRRIGKEVSHWDEQAQGWVPDRTHTLLYDGWNVIRETVRDTQSAVTNYYTWGLDLSGTPQGAGGVGGLLAVTIVGTGSQQPAVYYPCYDANGNVTEYVDAYGNPVAHRGYDAFGDTVAISGPMAGTFSLWFSTKYWDVETGLYYYGYRFYHPELGRWMNRDPIEEKSAANLYVSVENNFANNIDYCGLLIVTSRNPNNKCGCRTTSELQRFFESMAESFLFDKIREPFQSAVKEQFKKMKFECCSDSVYSECGGNFGHTPATGVFNDISYEYDISYRNRLTGDIQTIKKRPVKFPKSWRNTAVLCNDRFGKDGDLLRYLRVAIHETAHNIGWGNHYEEKQDPSFSNKLPSLDGEHRRTDWGIPSGND